MRIRLDNNGTLKLKRIMYQKYLDLFKNSKNKFMGLPLSLKHKQKSAIITQ